MKFEFLLQYIHKTHTLYSLYIFFLVWNTQENTCLIKKERKRCVKVCKDFITMSSVPGFWSDFMNLYFNQEQLYFIFSFFLVLA